MSADEIRNLALGKVPIKYKRAADGFVVLDDLAVRSALLDYAAMVERCEEKIAEYKSYVDVGIVAENISDMNYILKGATIVMTGCHRKRLSIAQRKELLMPDKKNALEELAKRLRNGLYINPNDKRFDGPVIVRTLDANDVLAAQRIVAEVAKVKTLGPKHIPGDVGLYKAYTKIRAIAEEGAVDGK